jgi:hypothetical protein
VVGDTERLAGWSKRRDGCPEYFEAVAAISPRPGGRLEYVTEVDERSAI